MARVVKQKPQGKERSIGLVILLMFVTLGIYGLVWRYKVHQEVFEQFQLGQEGRKNGKLWFWLGWLLFGPLMLLYDWIFVSNVAHARQRLGLPRGISPGGYLGLILIPNILVLVLQIAIQIPSTFTGPTMPVWAFLAIILGIVLVSLVLSLIAISLVQRDVNGLWQARRQRSPAPPAPPVIVGGPSAAAGRTPVAGAPAGRAVPPAPAGGASRPAGVGHAPPGGLRKRAK